jgi:hypothetical protein
VADSIEASNATVDNPASISRKQKPLWLNNEAHTDDIVQILSQEDFFDEEGQGCLPTFNSLTIENQIFNTKSDTDRVRLHSYYLVFLVNINVTVLRPF